MADTQGIVFLRTLRPKTPVIYEPSVDFPIGGSKILRSSDEDAVTVVAAGITVHEAIKAADGLQESGVAVRVIDAYSIKPIDVETLRAAARATGGKVVAVEDHWPEGGLGEAVLSALSREADPLYFEHLAVIDMPGSGKSEELLDAAGISASHIADAVRNLASS
jgi:transketolase